MVISEAPLVGWSAVSSALKLSERKLRKKMAFLMEVVDPSEESIFSIVEGKLIVFEFSRFKSLLRLDPEIGITLSDFCWAFEIRPSTVKQAIYHAINHPGDSPLNDSVDFFAYKRGWRIADPQNFLNKVVYGDSHLPSSVSDCD